MIPSAESSRTAAAMVERATKQACELCGRFDAEFEDPTFDISKVAKAGRENARPLRLCELCAKTRIETEMMRLGTVIQ